MSIYLNFNLYEKRNKTENKRLYNFIICGVFKTINLILSSIYNNKNNKKYTLSCLNEKESMLRVF